MEPREEKRAMRILSLICVVLAVLLTAMGILFFHSFLNDQDLQSRVKRLQEENSAWEQQVKELQQQNMDQQTALTQITQERDNALQEAEALRAEAAARAEEAAEAEQEAQVTGAIPGIDATAPGELLDRAAVDANLDAYFLAHEIVEGDEVYQRIIGKSYRENENIGLSDLRYLKMAHFNFDHQVQSGEMIVNAAIAEDVLEIFKELYQIEYEIQSIYLVDNYWTGDGNTTDTASIEENNTSAFNYRPVTNGGNLSNHAYGRSIDLNPQQNPYVWYDANGSLRWSHENANAYIDRTSGDPHVIVAGDACYNIFIKHGFTWGGEWSNPIDYQHFDKVG